MSKLFDDFITDYKETVGAPLNTAREHGTQRILGVRIDPITKEPIEVENEADNFYNCEACGQAVDMRDLGEVFHHEEAGHKPLPVT